MAVAQPTFTPVMRRRRALPFWMPLTGMGMLLVAGAGYWYWTTHRATGSGSVAQQGGIWPAWMQTDAKYTADRALPTAAVTPRDTQAEELAALKARIAQLEAQRQTQAAVQHPAPVQPVRAAVKRPSDMLFVTKPFKESSASTVPTYRLAPWATKLACVVEMLLNSEVPGYFTCKVTAPVYDTATGQVLLVPPGSTIGAKYSSEQLLYGNERLPTVALELTLPNGQTVTLGNAPIMDQAGTQGLTGDVDQHYLQLFGAIFVGGALKGGAQAMQTAAASAGGADAVITGVGQTGSQALNQRVSRALDTRPTIRVFPRSEGIVLLTKPLDLPAFYR